MSSMLTAPASLLTVTIGLSFMTIPPCSDATDLILSALHALNWDILDRLLQTHPNLSDVQIQLPQNLPSESVEGVQKAIKGRMPVRLTSIARISMSSNLRFI